MTGAPWGSYRQLQQIPRPFAQTGSKILPTDAGTERTLPGAASIFYTRQVVRGHLPPLLLTQADDWSNLSIREQGREGLESALCSS
jgi:hypothetical protein